MLEELYPDEHVNGRSCSTNTISLPTRSTMLCWILCATSRCGCSGGITTINANDSGSETSTMISQSHARKLRLAPACSIDPEWICFAGRVEEDRGCEGGESGCCA